MNRILWPLLPFMLAGCNAARWFGGGGEEQKAEKPWWYEALIEFTVGEIVEMAAKGMAALFTMGLLLFVVLMIASGFIDSWFPGVGKMIRSKGKYVIIGLLVGIVSCGVVGFLGHHMYWVALLIVILGLAYLALLFWQNRKKAEKALGVDIPGI